MLWYYGVKTIFFLFCIAGAWPVLIDEFVEYAKPLIGPKSTTVWGEGTGVLGLVVPSFFVRRNLLGGV